ncbi:MAG: cell division protein FtsZ [Candidatus Paceibacterota bacterium]|jgi:cell division protein FtsZ
MPKINPEIESFARIKVVGVGGSGTNAVNHMVESKVQGVEFIVMNTDAQHLHHSPANKKLHIGKNLTRGLGTGMDPDLGRRAAEESLEDIQALVKGADMVFISCGMGGGTGTGAAPVIAKVAKEMGALTIGVVTRPFYFEAKQRKTIADKGLEELKKEVDAIISIPNDRLLNMISKDTTLTSAFSICDDVLKQAVEGISNTITMPGQINADFADIKTIMQNSGSTLMGVGVATGENRATEAAKLAISSPLLDVSITGAKGILFTVSGGDDVTLFELQEAAKVITESIDPEAKVIFGTIHDDKMKKNEVKITVIACGFPSDNNKKGRDDFKINFSTETTPIPTIENIEAKKETREEEESKKIDILNANIKTAEKEKEEVKPILNTKDKKEDSFEDDDWSSIPAFLRRSKTK